LAAVCLRATARKGLKHGLPLPVIGYIRDDTLHLDRRCLEARDEARCFGQLQALKF